MEGKKWPIEICFFQLGKLGLTPPSFAKLPSNFAHAIRAFRPR